MTMLTLEQTAHRLSLSPRSLADRRFRTRLGLPCTKVGRRIFFEEGAIEALIQRSRETFADPTPSPATPPHDPTDLPQTLQSLDPTLRQHLDASAEALWHALMHTVQLYLTDFGPLSAYSIVLAADRFQAFAQWMLAQELAKQNRTTDAT